LVQREIAQGIVDGGGDDIMPIKKNHKSVHRDIHALFRDAKMLSVSLATADAVSRRVQTSPAPSQMRDGAGRRFLFVK
jgi:hypothetical protein